MFFIIVSNLLTRSVHLELAKPRGNYDYNKANRIYADPITAFMHTYNHALQSETAPSGRSPSICTMENGHHALHTRNSGLRSLHQTFTDALTAAAPGVGEVRNSSGCGRGANQ